MRSIYFISRKKIDILEEAKEKVKTKDWNLWESGKTLGDVTEVRSSKNLGTDPIKFDARNWARALAPDIALLEIDKGPFAEFVEGEVKGKKSKEKKLFLIKFWEIKKTKKHTRAILAGKEEDTTICTPIEAVLAGPGPGLSRGTEWASVTFTHPDLRVRVQLYRYPTASICPERVGFSNNNYQILKEKFEAFLLTQVPKKASTGP